jgi:hypothetical protein
MFTECPDAVYKHYQTTRRHISEDSNLYMLTFIKGNEFEPRSVQRLSTKFFLNTFKRMSRYYPEIWNDNLKVLVETLTRVQLLKNFPTEGSLTHS